MKEKENQLYEAAKKVCTNHCISSFACGKTKISAGHLPLCGTNKVCPLQEYNVQHREGKEDMMRHIMCGPTMEDLDLLCENCKHRDKYKDTRNTFSLDSCFETHCIDCPVQMDREGIEETIAEAMMS